MTVKKEDFLKEKLMPLQAWLEETGFTRANFKVIEPFLVLEKDFFIHHGRYFIDERAIRESILSREEEWKTLLQRKE